MSTATQAKAETQKIQDKNKHMTNNYPPGRKSPVRLTEDEQYAVYKYCIENHCVYQIEAAIEFRVEATKIAIEIVKHYSKIVNNKSISSYHVKSAVEATVGWQKRLGKLPIVPLETAELEQLKLAKIKHIKEIEQLKFDLSQVKADLEASSKGFRSEIELARRQGNSAVAMVDKIKQLLNGAPKAVSQP